MGRDISLGTGCVLAIGAAMVLGAAISVIYYVGIVIALALFGYAWWLRAKAPDAETTRRKVLIAAVLGSMLCIGQVGLIVAKMRNQTGASSFTEDQIKAEIADHCLSAAENKLTADFSAGSPSRFKFDDPDAVSISTSIDASLQTMRVTGKGVGRLQNSRSDSMSVQFPCEGRYDFLPDAKPDSFTFLTLDGKVEAGGEFESASPR